MVCRHCYHLVAPSDPQLALDRTPIAAPGSGPRGAKLCRVEGLRRPDSSQIAARCSRSASPSRSSIQSCSLMGRPQGRHVLVAA